MGKVERFPQVNWGDTHVRFVADVAMNLPDYPVDTVLVFVFHQHQFVLANIVNRGWTIPGGRMEPGETREAAVKREAFEETGAVLSGLLEIGFYLLTNRSGEIEKTRRVPAYIAHANELNPVPKGFESSGVMHASLGRLPEVYYIWDPLIESVFNYVHSRAVLLGWSA